MINTMFEKKFKRDFPKRNLLHKFFIFLTFLFAINIFFNFIVHNSFGVLTNTISFLCWGFQWYLQSEKYQNAVEEYKEQAQKDKHDLDMKNAFNFGYYQQK